MPLDILSSGRSLATIIASCTMTKRNKGKLTVSNPVIPKYNLWAVFKTKEKLCSNRAYPGRKVYKIISPPPRGSHRSHSQEHYADNNGETVLCSEVSWDLAEREDDDVEEGSDKNNRTGLKSPKNHAMLSSLDLYSPTRSPKVQARRKITHDFDVWREVLVYHRETGEKRSFFVSENTNRKVWDEPPTGATKIVYQPMQIYQKHNCDT